MTALALGLVVVGGCGSDRTVPSAPPATATAVVATGPIRVDRALVNVLPPEVSGITVAFSPDDSARTAASSDVSWADALANAVALDDRTGDLAVATVLRPRESAFDEAAFRDLHETYAASVCGGEEGLRGNAAATLGSRTVQIGTCADGGHTYAARLERSGIVVVAFSRGDRRLGEELMARLRDP